MGTIRVVCGVIFNEGRILLCRRKPEKPLGGYWEFPGGKIEVGETEEESLYRELQEELGIRVEIERYFKSVVHDYDGFTIELIAYICRSGQSVCVLTDHDEYEWVDKSELLNWKLAPADIPIANELCFMDV
ncbi:(deoxy)nucleoside triphosphate pyrophosphohydrolase [Elizabethkingia anophelis]|uniref:(deoxy)nucleoside triphosphate pyrophosphohydrolase n=1 Tax=Elizabethkingia anophelis TaxID=1117645 RepID=UPI000994BACE|nr:(deoxy)nucleoside triphosphate pyrophosphohydrolase [Elizabethkingia anophelis]AQW99529.1 NUDIX hydrolase [Elizabethkingia anophelis]AQX90069.1 NUDIX hydrolase [Elizabethkingia anophelis]ASV79387.1 (deoxy)nucleoside triphosphate pyrophosphohydrolase [Elizabethkingia anophelis]MCL1649607.1 (deoxy)nucleoside triphosphate pyrophosphohydrolase [Elizabethkingia anophelis]MCL1684245.1 (deoxy)nucleoside triphosphate pyrophosphohydrolase [Elizabethkingia anophelis]